MVSVTSASLAQIGTFAVAALNQHPPLTQGIDLRRFLSLLLVRQHDRSATMAFTAMVLSAPLRATKPISPVIVISAQYAMTQISVPTVKLCLLRATTAAIH